MAASLEHLVRELGAGSVALHVPNEDEPPTAACATADPAASRGSDDAQVPHPAGEEGSRGLGEHAGLERLSRLAKGGLMGGSGRGAVFS